MDRNLDNTFLPWFVSVVLAVCCSMVRGNTSHGNEKAAGYLKRN